MIDYIKLNVSHAKDTILSNHNLSFMRPINQDTGEHKNYRSAKYRNLTFISKGDYMEVSGSLHKYFNKGEHNYNDFTYQDMVSTIMMLNENYNIDPYIAKIQNLEFGVNLKVDFNPKSFIKANIINFKGNAKSQDTKIKGKGYCSQFEMTNYIFKIYDKGLQYKQPENILRIEVKTKRMEHIKKTGIETLADLLDIDKLMKLKQILLKTFDDLLIVDFIDTKVLTAKEKSTYQNGINPIYWVNIIPDSKGYENGSNSIEYKRERKKYDQAVKRFKKLQSKYNLSKSKDKIALLIQSKCNQLLKTDKNTNLKIVPLTQIRHATHISEIGGKLTTYNDHHNNCQKREINNLCKTSIDPLPDESCSFFSKAALKDYTHEYLLSEIKYLVEDYYDGMLSDYRMIDSYSANELTHKLKVLHNIVLSTSVFLDYLKEIYPGDIVCPF